MSKQRLDQLMVIKRLVATRSQAESWIKLGKVTIDGKTVTKPGFFARLDADVQLGAKDRYVSRAGLKLASVARVLKLDFRNKVVLDVGSSTGGFTDYALQHGAKQVIAVDVGTNQLHPSLRSNPKVELYEKTNILEVGIWNMEDSEKKQTAGGPDDIPHSKFYIPAAPDIVLIDVSFISIRQIIPHVSTLMTHDSSLVAMVKPQFEAGKHQVNKGIIKNDTVRRQVLKAFEEWVRQYAVIHDKADSDITGSKGNHERFYLLRKLQHLSLAVK